MATQQQQEAIYQEGRTSLAIQAYKLGQFQTPTAFPSSISLLTRRDAPRSEMPPSHVKGILLVSRAHELRTQPVKPWSNVGLKTLLMIHFYV